MDIVSRVDIWTLDKINISLKSLKALFPFNPNKNIIIFTPPEQGVKWPSLTCIKLNFASNFEMSFNFGTYKIEAQEWKHRNGIVISISTCVIYDEVRKHHNFTLTTTYFHINKRLLMSKTYSFKLASPGECEKINIFTITSAWWCENWALDNTPCSELQIILSVCRV